MPCGGLVLQSYGETQLTPTNLWTMLTCVSPIGAGDIVEPVGLPIPNGKGPQPNGGGFFPKQREATPKLRKSRLKSPVLPLHIHRAVLPLLLKYVFREPPGIVP
jgi:hypothetical protein